MNAIVACALHQEVTRTAVKTASAMMGGQVEAAAMIVHRPTEITAEMGETATIRDPPTIQEVTNTRATEERGNMIQEGLAPNRVGLLVQEECKINLDPHRVHLYSLLKPLLSLDRVHSHLWHSSSLLRHSPLWGSWARRGHIHLSHPHLPPSENKIHLCLQIFP